MWSIALKIFRGISTVEFHIIYRSFGSRIILKRLILPITPSGSLAQDCVRDFRYVNSGSILLMIYSMGSLVFCIPRFLKDATLCKEREAERCVGDVISRGIICDFDQFMLSPECFPKS